MKPSEIMAWREPLRWILVSSFFGLFELKPLFEVLGDANYCSLPGGHAYPESIPQFSDSYELSGVHVFFRHGSRTSLCDANCFSGRSSNYDCSSSVSSFGISSLTAVSKRFMPTGCEKGQLLVPQATEQFKTVSSWLKKNYGRFFDNLSAVYLRSTDMERTLGSMILLLNEIFGQCSSDMQVTTRDLSGDALALDFHCARLDELEREFELSEDHQSLITSEPYKRCQDLWLQWAGSSMTSMDDSMDCLISAACVNAAFPVTTQVPEELMQCVVSMELQDRRIKYGQSLRFRQQGHEMCRLAVGPVLDELQNVLEAKTTSLWASHDSTLLCLLQALTSLNNQVDWDGNWPRYAETLVFEKYERKPQSTGDHEVMIRVLREGVVMGQFSMDAFVGEKRYRTCNVANERLDMNSSAAVDREKTTTNTVAVPETSVLVY